jgi:hypothetical protein
VAAIYNSFWLPSTKALGAKGFLLFRFPIVLIKPKENCHNLADFCFYYERWLFIILRLFHFGFFLSA